MIVQEIEKDGCVDLAAQMSFYFVLSLFPFLLVLAAVVGWMPYTNLWEHIVQWIVIYVPPEGRQIILTTILALPQAHTGFLSVGLLAAVWAASSGFVSLMESLSLAYEIPETRSFWKKRARALGATACSILFLIVSFGIWTFGKRFGDPVLISGNWRSHAARELMKWGATLAVIFIALDLIYYFMPDGDRPWRWFTPGRVSACLGIVITTQVFGLYSEYFGRYPEVYGALSGFVIVLTLIYMWSLILLIGAEIDDAIGKVQARTD